MKFGIDLGHCVGPDRGAVGNIAEETIINDVGKLVISKLKALGHGVIELRPSNASSVSDSLYQRYSKADSNNVDMCVSIHANAGGGVGTEVFTYKGKEVPEAAAVLNNIVSLGFRNRGIKDGSHLAMVKRPKATAMLIEICFVDSSDTDLYNNLGADKIANAIVQGLTGQEINATSGEWIKEGDKWKYRKSDGSFIERDWLEYKNNWYYFNEHGYMLSAEWLHLTSTGCDYYFYSDGTMAHDCELWGTYKFDNNGHASKINV